MKPFHGKIQFRVFWLLFLAMAFSAAGLAIRQSPLILGLNLLLLLERIPDQPGDPTEFGVLLA